MHSATYSLPTSATPTLRHTRADVDGATPLHAAATHGRPEAARCLLEHAADPAAPDRAGNTPLHCVAWQWEGRREGDFAALARALLVSGGSAVAHNKKGETPLSVAEDLGIAALHSLFMNSSEAGGRRAGGGGGAMGGCCCCAPLCHAMLRWPGWGAHGPGGVCMFSAPPNIKPWACCLHHTASQRVCSMRALHAHRAPLPPVAPCPLPPAGAAPSPFKPATPALEARSRRTLSLSRHQSAPDPDQQPSPRRSLTMGRQASAPSPATSPLSARRSATLGRQTPTDSPAPSPLGSWRSLGRRDSAEEPRSRRVVTFSRRQGVW